MQASPSNQLRIQLTLFAPISLFICNFVFYRRLPSSRHLPRQGSIVELNVEAMVNPTNERLTDQSGVSALILGKAGPEVAQDLITLESCRTGDAIISEGHRLQSK